MIIPEEFLKNIKDNVAATRALVTAQGSAITALAKLVADIEK